MAFVSLNDNGSNRFEVALTELGAKYLAMGRGTKLRVSRFSLADFDINYQIAENVNTNTSFTNVPTIGKVISLTGIQSKSNCIPRVSESLNNRQTTLSLDSTLLDVQQAPVFFTITLPAPLFEECEITVP